MDPINRYKEFALAYYFTPNFFRKSTCVFYLYKNNYKWNFIYDLKQEEKIIQDSI